MSDTALTPPPANDVARPEVPKPWYIQSLEVIAAAVRNFRSLTQCQTAIAIVALVCVLVGRSEFWVIGFAVFAMLLIAICEYLKISKV